MNRVARDFWSEVLDLNTNTADEPRDRRATKSRRKKVRVVQTRRPTREAG